MLHIRYYVYILFVLIKFCSSEIIILHEPDNTIYTYGNSSSIGAGGSGIVYKGLGFAKNYFFFYYVYLIPIISL